MPTASAHPLTSQIIETEAQLRALIGEPAQLTCAKISDRLNSMTRLFVERSPFVCVATSDSAGNCDLSPRGDPAGFVRMALLGILVDIGAALASIDSSAGSRPLRLR